jgi:hypothetical protein
LRNIVLHIVLFFVAGTSLAQNSVLNSGKWFKVAVDNYGVYKLTADQFRQMGFDLSRSDPKNIRIFGYMSGMLPQSNAVVRPEDLVELTIFVAGEEDGKLDQGDYVLFYAAGPNTQSFVAGKNIFLLQTNLYSDKNFYFITVDDEPGRRLSTREAGNGGSVATTYHDFAFHELNELNILSSGREWYGENFELTPDRTFDVQISDIVPGSQIKVVSEVMSQSYNPSSFEIFYNGRSIGEQAVAVIPDSQYGAKGRIKRDTLIVDAADVDTQARDQKVRYNFKRATSRKSTGFLNYFSVNVERKLSHNKDQTIFRNGNFLNTLVQYKIENVSVNDRIWNVSDPYSPVLQQFASQGNTAVFSSTSGSSAEEFVVFSQTVPSPELAGDVENQNLHGMNAPDFLIVTHPDFVPEANRLADHRRNLNNISVTVVTVDQVYNEFSSGRQDVVAIRDFVRSLYLKGPSTLKNVLLFGKSSYDFKDRLPNNGNFVPTYESRNSLSPLETFSSDDFFTFMDESEGEWVESLTEMHTMDIGVGRLPVKSLDEARILVDKIVQYDTNKDRFGKWKKDIVFVADDGSNSDGFSSVHQSQANNMAEEIESFNSQFNTRKIFLGTYSKDVSPNGELIPEANHDIEEEFNRALIINYTGHGSEKLWADERVFTPEEIDDLRNKTYPFLVTATCEFGRHDDPGEISSAENSLLKQSGGCIGLVTTARPVNSSTNFELNQAFYNALLEKESDCWRTIGEVFRLTKNNSTSGVANRNFSLLGDPFMTLGLPQQNIIVDDISTESGSDTLSALSKVVVIGKIVLQNGETDQQFNGTVEATLFDKRTNFQTIGRNNPAFKFSEWFNPLFRGQATAKNGEFTFSFILPKNIAYAVNPGKLSIYAYNADKQVDATGSSSGFKVGGSASNPPVDNKSPVIQAFMGDSTFVNGGTVSPNTTLVVRLHDESGINISNYGIGNTMMAILDDDSEVYLINESFVNDRDDYTAGWVYHPLYDLPPGPHSLTVKAWDTHNNPAEARVDFVVSEENSFVIEEAGNFPNPFFGETTLFFTHNRPGEDLTAQVTILSSSGSELKRYDVDIPESTYRVELLKFEDASDLGKKLPPGLYFARFRVRSVTDGAERTRVTKLILVN